MEPQVRYGVSGLLTWVAGYVDAVGWLTWRHTYTANMSGNSVAIGIQSAAGAWGETALRVWPVAMYVAGLVVCRIAIEMAARRRQARVAWLLFLIEMALLAGAIVLQPGLFGGIALLALAMGFQNAALTKFGGTTLHTGFVTGELVKFSEHFTKYLFWLNDGGRLAASPQEQPFRRAVWMLALWMAYVAGAVSGALADKRWALPALLAPLCALAMLAFYDLRSPLAVAEEKEQLSGGG